MHVLPRAIYERKRRKLYHSNEHVLERGQKMACDLALRQHVATCDFRRFCWGGGGRLEVCTCTGRSDIIVNMIRSCLFFAPE